MAVCTQSETVNLSGRNPPQSVDDGACLSGRPPERWQNFGIESWNIPKCYVEGSFSLILDFAIQRDRAAVVLSAQQHNIREDSLSRFMLQFNAHNGSDGDERDQEVVFVVNVESIDKENVRVPSLVRFYPIQHQVADGMNARYFSILRQRGFKFLPCPLRINGEPRPLVRSLETQLADDFDPHNIQGGMEIVNRIANTQSNVGGQLPISMSTLEVLLPGLTVDVDAGAVVVSRAADSLFDLRDVLIGPFDFEQGIPERVIPDFAHD